MNNQICQKWFAKLCPGDFSLNNTFQSIRLVVIDNDHMKTWLENNHNYIAAIICKISKSNAENQLHQLGYVNHFDVWHPCK